MTEHPSTVRDLRSALDCGMLSARDLVDQALEAIADPAGEGSKAFLTVAADRARAQADHYDAERAAGRPLPPFAGLPVAIKDLADVAGEVTRAGSVVLADDAPATADAPAVARLRHAGFIPIGRTNMTEFAYSGLGLNCHYDTPASPWDRANRHVPGGSSSGSAVAVADRMAAVALGTDTGGSCRIPAAYCGIVGFKPSADRVPLAGIVPLAPSLDSVGPLGRSVDCCAIVDDIFAGGSGLVDSAPRSLHGVRLAVITDYVLDELDPEVAAGFAHALGDLSAAGATVVEVPFPELNEIPTINRGGGLAAAEAFHFHRAMLADRGGEYDPRVGARIEAGALLSAADYIEVQAQRRRLIAAAHRRLVGFDAFALPTVANLPPAMSWFGSIGDEGYSERYNRANLLALRNTTVGNFLDGCAISLPVTGDVPVGFMLMANHGGDEALFALARAAEAVI